MPPSRNVLEAVQRLYDWQFHNTSSFSNQIYDLFQKADPENFQALADGFIYESVALRIWHSSNDFGNELFRKFNIGHFANEVSNGEK